jgi:hypothetical protein
VASAGDVNGDGYADFVVGAYGANSNVGAAHVYLGGPTPNVADWNGSSPAKRIDLASPQGTDQAYFGLGIIGAGDVNGDGYADFLVSDVEASSGAGASHLYLGGPMPNLADWNGASPAKRIDLTNPDGPNALFGSVAYAGDVNGDGYADFLVAALQPDSDAGGAAHLYLGEPTPSPTDWNGATPARRIDLTNPDGAHALFSAVGSAGDINGDGYDDFLVGAPYASSNAGASHLYLGGPTPGATSWNGAMPAKRLDLTNPDGANAEFGIGMGVGDVNGDGIADFIVAAEQGGAGAGGVAHLYLGELTPSGTDWNAAASAKRIDLINPDGANAKFY